MIFYKLLAIPLDRLKYNTTYVSLDLILIIDRNTYKTKLDDILNDDSKFTRITDDPIKNLKKQLNYIAKANNAVSNYMKLPVLVGDYKPGYIYENCDP